MNNHHLKPLRLLSSSVNLNFISFSSAVKCFGFLSFCFFWYLSARIFLVSSFWNPHSDTCLSHIAFSRFLSSTAFCFSSSIIYSPEGIMKFEDGLLFVPRPPPFLEGVFTWKPCFEATRLLRLISRPSIWDLSESLLASISVSSSSSLRSP